MEWSGHFVCSAFGRGVGLLLGLAAALWASGAGAVNIVPIWEDAGVFPDEDLDGTAIQTMMGHVETYLEDMFEASGTLTVYYRYMEGGFGSHTNLTTSGGKPTSCRIRLSADYDWWFDPTPEDDSEFTMVSKRASDYNATDLATYYNGTVPNLVEVQYQGSTKTSAPAEAKAHFDAWTVLLHEMGHGLGITGNVASAEYADNDYDFDPQMVWGNTMAANINGTDPVHLAAPALMHGGEIRGRRKLLSATDVFAIETTCNWGDATIDLLRKDFYSASATASWDAAGNWAGNRAPDAADAAFVRHGGTAQLLSDVSVASIAVDAGSALALSKTVALTAQSLTLSHGVKTVLELGGLNPGVNSAWMHVAGSAKIDGTLELTLASNYQPRPGDVFDLFDFDGGYTGAFDSVITPENYLFNWSNFAANGSVTLVSTGVPTAVNDAYDCDEDGSIVIDAPAGALANDTDPNGDPLVAVQKSNTAHGTLTFYASGAVAYEPNANYYGVDTFTYAANDGVTDSNVATVTLSIASVNDAPIAEGDAYSTDEGSPLTVYSYRGVLANDADPDNSDFDTAHNDPLTAVLQSDASGGALDLYSSGGFKYTPDDGFCGEDRFTYRVFDGAAYSNSATVIMRVLAALQIPGDANRDGMVNENDAAQVAGNWGKSGATWAMGDFNGDGVVGPADASILAANWGYGNGEAIASTPAVPEPSSLALLLAAAMTFPPRRRR